MKVAVIGAGGVGGFLAVMLARGGHDVSVLARGAHLQAIQQHGLRLRSQQFGDLAVRPTASSDPAALGRAELVIVGVKMYDFEAAAHAAGQALADTGVALTIQNGLDAPNLLAQVVGERRVLIGTASIEATVLEPGVIGHLVPIHSLTISEFAGGPTPRLEAMLAIFKGCEINASIAPDGRQALWDKAASLIPIATLTASAGAGIGLIYNLPETRQLFDALMHEAAAVASAHGHRVDAAQAGFTAMMQQAARVRPDFTTSMDRDFRNGRRTELEWLTGSLIRLAGERQVDVPVHRVLYALLKLEEQRTANRSSRLAGATA